MPGTREWIKITTFLLPFPPSLEVPSLAPSHYRRNEQVTVSAFVKHKFAAYDPIERLLHEF